MGLSLPDKYRHPSLNHFPGDGLLETVTDRVGVKPRPLAEPPPEPPADSGPSADAVDAAARLGDLALDPADRARLIRLHPHMRAMAESLRLPELPDLEPSPLFRAG